MNENKPKTKWELFLETNYRKLFLVGCILLILFWIMSNVFIGNSSSASDFILFILFVLGALLVGVGLFVGSAINGALPDNLVDKGIRVVTEKCPYCFNKVSVHAKKCPHCHSDLSDV